MKKNHNKRKISNTNYNNSVYFENATSERTDNDMEVLSPLNMRRKLYNHNL